MSDRRVEALIRAAAEDVQPLAKRLQELGWPVEVRVDASPDGTTYTVTVVVTVLPVLLLANVEQRT